jgi:hypothetical protein
MTGPNRTEIDRLRETVAWMAQTVHQAHHSTGSWQECPKSVCQAAANALLEVEK